MDQFKNKVQSLEEELASVRKENEALRLMLDITSKTCKMLELQHINHNNNNNNNNNNSNNIDHVVSNKRARIYDHHRISIANKVSKQLFVRTDHKDKSLTVKDGYQWRKYGQKVTKDSLFPRAYFRCSMAPRCPAKKKVQRSTEDETILVATYDGQHNHDACGQFNHAIISSSSENQKNNHDLDGTRSAASTSSSPTPLSTLDLSVLSGLLNNNDDDNYHQMMTNRSNEVDNAGKPINIKRNYADECVSSLTKDPSFTLALVEAVARTMSNLGHTNYVKKLM